MSSLCTLVKIVRRPVAIVSALSRVVDLTLVKTAKNSFKASVPSLTPLLAVENTPPALCIAVIRSVDSTANLAATELIEDSAFSRSLVLTLNCLIKAILPSTVSLRLLNEGANSVNANALRAV